ncbi:MAG: nucleoside monophosphate kinase [Patescibacteria group bacterium]
MKLSKEKVIIILGPPGSGKGTQAELLADRLGLFHLETSKLIEVNLKNVKKGDFVKVGGKKYFLLQEKKARESGGLMSPPLISFWIKDKVQEVKKTGKGIVLSGSPRTLSEGKELIPLLKKLYGVQEIKIILLTLNAKDSIWRNSHRKTCQLFRHPILFDKETKNLTKCPFDGSKLFSRKDDNPKVIKFRLEEYKEKTLPVLDYLKKANLKLAKVNGAPPPAAVFQDILKTLKL